MAATPHGQLLVQKRAEDFKGNPGTQKSHVRDYVIRQLSATPGSSVRSSTPLIIPNDMVYDKEANTLRRVEGKKRSKLVPVPEALELLKQLPHKQIAVLAICGPQRSGKSYILSKMIDSPDAFKLGHSMDSETFGIWLGTSYLDFGDYAILLLDTEGIDAVSADGQDDMSILVMTVLLSSFLIYNSMRVPMRHDLQTMECFTQLAKSILINQSSDQEKSESAECRGCFPNFLWLLRDVILEVPEKKTPKQFIIDRVLKQNKAVGEAIMTLFPDVDCKLLPMPTTNKRILGHIEMHESELELDFTHGVIGLIEYLRENVKVKHGFTHGQRVDGPTLALLLEQYLEAVNTPDAIPCLEKTWDTVVDMRCSEVINSLVEEYACEMEQALHHKLPVEEEATPDEKSDPDQLQHKVFLMEVHSRILKKKEEKLLEEIKYITPAKNAHTSDAATQYKIELVKRLESKIIEARFDEMRGQVVTGGVVFRFIRENHEQSHAFCVTCFTEASAPLLEKLRSIKRSVTATLDAPRYTFQQFLDDRENLQMEYYTRAIGPAKNKVWEEKVDGLRELECVVKLLDGYQEETLGLNQQLAASVKKENELKDQVDEQTARNLRLENEMKCRETRLKEKHKENLKQREKDANEKLEQEKRKLEDLKKHKEISESERAITQKKMEQLQKDKEEAECNLKQKEIKEMAELQAQNDAIKAKNTQLLADQVEVYEKHKEKVEELEAALEKPHIANAELEDSDYAMITRAWFTKHKKMSVTKKGIKEECEKLEMKKGFGLRRIYKSDTLENWMVHFGKQAKKHALVNLKRLNKLSLDDVQCNKL